MKQKKSKVLSGINGSSMRTTLAAMTVVALMEVFMLFSQMRRRHV